MAKFKINIESVEHGAISCHHTGKDQAYCEEGELVIVKNMPSAGWGLQEVNYTDNADNVVKITDGEFVMPQSDITVSGTFKRFVVQDWTTGPDYDSNDGKVLAMDEHGNLQPKRLPLFVKFNLQNVPQQDDVLTIHDIEISDNVGILGIFNAIRAGRQVFLTLSYVDSPGSVHLIHGVYCNVYNGAEPGVIMLDCLFGGPSDDFGISASIEFRYSEQTPDEIELFDVEWNEV